MTKILQLDKKFPKYIKFVGPLFLLIFMLVYE